MGAAAEEDEDDDDDEDGADEEEEADDGAAVDVEEPPVKVAMNCCSPVGWGGTAPAALYAPGPPAGGGGIGVCGWL
jgi:hypothetical protein